MRHNVAHMLSIPPPLAPLAVDVFVRHLIPCCWGVLPPGQQTLEGVEAEARRAVDRALEHVGVEVEAFLHDFLTRSVEDSPGGGQPDSGRRARDLALMQVVHTCWISLPEGRRSAEEVGAQVRRLVDRALKDMWEDARAFGIPEGLERSGPASPGGA